MGGIVTLARSSIRRRWRAVVVVALLIGIGGGATVAAVAASRRTESALPRFVAGSHPLDASLYTPDITVAPGDDTLAIVRSLPSVAAAYRFGNVLAEGDDRSAPSGHSRQLPEFGVDDGALFQYGTPIVVAGRLADDQAFDEVMLSESGARKLGLHVGDQWHLSLFTEAQFSDAGTGAEVDAQGPALTFTVVGIVRFPYDLGRQYAQDTIYVNTVHAYLTPAFAQRYASGMASYGAVIGVRLGDGSSYDDLNADVATAVAGGPFVQRVTDDETLTGVVRPVQRSAKVSAVALLVLAVLLGLATLLLGGQALARDAAAQLDEAPALRAIGFTTTDLRAAIALRGALVAALAAGIAVVVAAMASPLAPIGLVRRAELHPGIELNVAVLAIGSVVVAAAVVARTVVATLRLGRPAARPLRRPALLRRVIGAMPAPSSLGAQFALGADQRYALVLRTVIVTIATGVAGCTAAVVLLSSLHALRDAPPRWGVTWDVAVGGFALPEEYQAGLETLARSGLAVNEVGVATGDVSVAGRNVEVVGFAGDGARATWPIVEGSFPRDGEVALGRLTADALGAHVGDDIDLQFDVSSEPKRVHVSGIALLNATLMDPRIEPGVGILTSTSIITGIDPVPEILLIKLRDGVDRAAALSRLQQDFPHTTQTPELPSTLANLVELQPLLAVLVGLVGVLAVGTLAHGMTLLVRGRRHDLAVLRTMGFTPRQATATVASSALTLGLVGTLIGVPIGLVAGRWGWGLVNDSLGLSGGYRAPIVLLLAALAGVLLVVVIIAAPPSIRAGRLRPSVLLRTE